VVGACCLRPLPKISEAILLLCWYCCACFGVGVGAVAVATCKLGDAVESLNGARDIVKSVVKQEEDMQHTRGLFIVPNGIHYTLSLGMLNEYTLTEYKHYMFTRGHFLSCTYVLLDHSTHAHH
jgi:hypothetical protein